MHSFFERLGSVIEEANSLVNDVVWGPVMIALLLGTGVYLTLRLGIPQLARIQEIHRKTIGKALRREKDAGEGTIASLQAGLASIACVVGTGNITGVATAIHEGGPGALFWMWLSAFFGMATKFAEIVLGIWFREKDARGEYVGGAMYYIYKGLKSKWAAYFFSLMAIFSYMVCGAIVDTNSICLGMQEQWGIAPWISGIIIAVMTAVVILGGVKRIGKVCEWLTPIMSAIYVLVGLGIIFFHLPQVPGVFAEIFRGAFTPQGAVGGFAGATVMQAMKLGLARGLNSNEAGMGSSPTLNCAATVDDPVDQGFWGIVEVFLDTIVICTITGLVILLSGTWTGDSDGTALAMSAFGTFLPGGVGNFYIMFSTLLFGYSCLITSNYLCEVSASFMWGEKSILPTRLVWIAFIIVGALGGLEFVWDLADTANGLMAVPNLVALLLLSPMLVKIVKGSGEKKGQKKERL